MVTLLGHHHGSYDDLLICASKGLSEGLVRVLEPFHTSQNLVGYQASYLSGWGAEEYAVGPKEAWDKGQQRFEQHEYSACSAQVPGDTHRNLRISMRLSSVTWKHCLLPVYVAAYRYNDKVYRFLVNGETGKVSGEAPYSFWKDLLRGGQPFYSSCSSCNSRTLSRRSRYRARPGDWCSARSSSFAPNDRPLPTYPGAVCDRHTGVSRRAQIVQPLGGADHPGRD